MVEVKHCLKFDGLIMTLLEMPVYDVRAHTQLRAVPGLRLSALTESVDLVELTGDGSVTLAAIKEQIEKAIARGSHELKS